MPNCAGKEENTLISIKKLKKIEQDALTMAGQVEAVGNLVDMKPQVEAKVKETEAFIQEIEKECYKDKNKPDVQLLKYLEILKQELAAMQMEKNRFEQKFQNM